MTCARIMHPDARDIARMVSAPQMLRHLGWRIRPRNRADCGLCRGRSMGTVAYREEVWHCHRCHAGGDVFSLVQAVKRCGFSEALQSVADLAGVRLEDHQSDVNMRCELAARHQEREQIEQAAEALAAMERGLRSECRDRIHLAEHKLTALSEQSAWSGRDWLLASLAWGMLRDDLPAYWFLSFGTTKDRARYVLDPESRDEIVAQVRCRGGFRTADGGFVEVPA